MGGCLTAPAYGQWDSVLLDDQNKRAVYIAEGLGHGFMAMVEDNTVSTCAPRPMRRVASTVSTRSIPRLALPGPETDSDGQPLRPLLSPKEAALPTLAGAAELGVLPTFEQATSFYAELDRK